MTNRKAHISITTKISCLVLALTVSTTALLFFISINEMKKNIIIDKKQHIQSTLINLQETLNLIDALKHASRAQQIISGLYSDTSLNKAYLFDENYKVIASTSIKAIGKKIDNVLQESFKEDIKIKIKTSLKEQKNIIWKSTKTNTLHGVSPVQLPQHNKQSLLSHHTGIVYTSFDISKEFTTNKRKLTYSFLIPAIITLAIGAGLIISYIHFTIAKRINLMSTASKNLLESNYKMRLIANGNDEISEAFNEFNLMASDLEKSKHVLEKHSQEQRDILNFMVDAVVTITQKGTILSINKSAEKMFGYLPEEVINKNVNMLMPAPYHAEHDGYLERFINTNDAHIIGIGREVTALSKTNILIPIRLSVAEIPPALDGGRRFIGSCIDLTHEKKQSEEKKRTQRLVGLGNLAGGIAHDFNNLLAIINGYSELLSDQTDIQGESKGYLAEITKAGDRGHNLTKRLLAFSRGKMIDYVNCNINALIQENKNNLHNSLSTNNKLALNLEDKIWNILVDPSELLDAILNMAINAKHAMSTPGSLTLTSKNLAVDRSQGRQLHLEPGDYVELCITDTGLGMDEQTLEQIFDPFFSTKGDAGTGLGLSQVYGFVKRVNAHMRVNSTLGEGSRFCIYFPRHLETNKNKVNHQDSTNNKHNTNETKTILVVDDEASLNQLASHFLIQAGYNTITANCAEQALELLKNKKVDLILSDVIMSGMNGYELYRQVKIKYPSIKFLLASGFDEENKITHDEVDLQMKLLHKPYLKKDLLSRITDAFLT